MRINGIDYHYYTNLKDIYSPQYDWENLILTAGTSEENLDFKIRIADRNPVQLKSIQHFIHEYIHYLQNFSTIWGAGVFSDLFIAYSKISVSKITGNQRFTPPLNNKRIENSLFDEGVKMRTEILQRLVKNDSFKYELKNEIKSISYYYDAERIFFTNGIFDASVGIKAIREHMANIGSLLTLGYSDDEINYENNNCEQFLDDEKRLYNYPEYWMIFEYFKSNYPNFKNIGRGIFYLCNECLTRANPDKAFFRFFDFFESNYDKHLVTKEFIDFVNQWMHSHIENQSIHASYTLTIDHLNQRLDYINKNLQHDLPKHALPIVTMIKENLEKTKGGRKIFSNLLNFSDLNYWESILNQFGSCIISFNQEIKLFGNTEFIDNKLKPFMSFNSVTLAFRELNKNGCDFTCPFFIDIPICNSEYKQKDTCDKKPFELLKKQNLNSCCNLMAGIFLLGLENRINCEEN